MKGKELRELSNAAVGKDRKRRQDKMILDSLAKIKRTITEPEEQRWIPVKERVPEESGKYLAVTDSGVIEVFYYSAKHQAFNAFDDLQKDPDTEIPCTHWMPLPEPPEVE